MIKVLAIAFVLIFTFSPAWALRCANVDSKDAIREYRTFEEACPPSIPHMDVRWLPAPEVVTPSYDAATQIIEGPTVTVGQDAVTQEYTVRDKTAEELAAETEGHKEGILSNVGELVLRRLCDHESRLRVLEGKSAVTWEQCRKAIKDALQ